VVLAQEEAEAEGQEVVKGTVVSTTKWMNARELITWMEDNKVASMMTFGYDIARLMRWVAVQKMVIQSPASTRQYVIKSKKPQRSDVPERVRGIALFKVITRTVEPLIPPRSEPK
jgi:hypothetical protein